MRLTLRAAAPLLKSREKDFVMLLRVGAGVNAVESNSRMLVKVGPGLDEVDALARMICVCNGLAHFRELVTMIDKEKYLDRLMELAKAGMDFSPIQVSLAEGRELLSPAHPDLGGNPLLKLRDKISFHWDPHAFRDFVAADPDGVFDLWRVGGDPLDRVFSSSAYAIAKFTLEVPTTGKDAEAFMNGFVSAVGVVGHVLEAAFLGLLIECGVADPRRHLVKEDK